MTRIIIALISHLLILPALTHTPFENIVQEFLQMVNSEIRKARTFVLPVNAAEHVPYSDLLLVNGGTFDFVVIGAGASGAPLAARLSEVSGWTTLVLEAGCIENDFIDIPAMQGYAKHSKYNWGFRSEPQNSSCLGYAERRCPHPRGKGLGGSTLINIMLYARQRPADFDDMAADGNPGWDYRSVIEYFKRTENASAIDGIDFNYRGFDGPMRVNNLPTQSDQSKAFIAAHEELGIAEFDYNGDESFGVSRTQLMTTNGRRLSTYRAYLEPVLYRHNLAVQCDSFVVKVLPCEKAVLYVQNGQLFYALARKEIVLSAGSFGTPQILMLSGVGPEEHLLRMGVPVLRNLAVGENLQDHLSFAGVMFSTNLTYVDRGDERAAREFFHGTGPFAVPNTAESIAFYDTPSNAFKGSPSVEVIQLTSPILNGDAQRILELNDESYANLFKGVNGNDTFVVQIVGLHPKSRGTVRLRSNNPFDYPLIETRFLTDAGNEDINTIYEGIRLVQRLEGTESFKRIDAKLIYPELPACGGTVPDSMEYWHCLIRQLGFNIYHPVGTAKMGPKPCDGDVVDARFKVHGFDSLRVVDASIFPKSFSGHPTAACVMIAEKAFDAIVEDYYFDIVDMNQNQTRKWCN